MSAVGDFPEGWFSYSNSVQRLTAGIASQNKQESNFHLKVNSQSNFNTDKHVRFEI